MACVEAGVPALIEKPVAHKLADDERLFKATQASTVPLLVGHHRAHSPLLAQARAVVQQGLLGRVVAVTGSAMFCKPDDYFNAAAWRRQAGGGSILINLIHEIGNLRALCGEIGAVQALVSNAVRGFEVEDTVAITLRFASGALGGFMLSDTAACARSWEQTSQEDPSFPTYPDQDCHVMAGTQGRLSVPTTRIKRYADPQDRSWWTPLQASTLALERADPLALQLAHLCEVIRGHAQPLVTAHDGLAKLRGVQAIAQTARSGVRVPTSCAPGCADG